MNYYVYSVNQILPDQWEAKIAVTSGRSVILNFVNYPSMDDIQSATAKFIENEQKALQPLTPVVEPSPAPAPEQV